MKIALISDIRTVHAQRWATSIAKKEDELIVISIAPGVIDGCMVYNLRMLNEKGIRFFTFIKKLRYIFLSWIILLKARPDIVHVHFLRPDISTLSYLFFKNTIISVWGNDIIDDKKPSMLKHIYRKIALKRAKKITATTEYLAKQTQKYCKGKEIKIIPFGVDLNRFKSYKKETKTVTHVGFVKHLMEKYGPHILIEAVKFIKNDVVVYLVGDGYMKGFLEKLIKKYNLKNVFLKGFIDNNELPKFLNNIDIFVMPSIYKSETFGVAAIEAQAMEIPVIASDIGGISEAVKNGITGILVTPNDPIALAKAIDRLIDDKELYQKLSGGCRKYVESRFNWEKNVISVIDLYNKIV